MFPPSVHTLSIQAFSKYFSAIDCIVISKDKTILSPSSAGTYSSLLSERLPPVASEILSILPAFPFKKLSNFASIPSNP